MIGIKVKIMVFLRLYSNIIEDIYANDGLEETDNDALAKENGDAIANMLDKEDKQAENAKTKASKTKKMDEEKNKGPVEDVESASGEKMVRAAHVPVPSQVII